MLIHWIWLATRPGLNDREKLAVLEQFRDPETIFFADAANVDHIPGISPEGAASLRDKDLLGAEQILVDCARKKIHILTIRDGAYPAKLKNIADPPLVLYYKGTLPALDSAPVIGIVGTRSASSYGMNTAKRMGYQIGRCGGFVVSGMARGIDSEAMAGALTAGTFVIGILGCGVDVVYPASSRALYEDLERHGCLISEFVPGMQPAKWTFPKRNRIISGISDGVLVVEAPEKSGALITARRAADQGRDVFAVPGNIDVPSCAGTNALLRDGATLASDGWDVVGEYRHLYPNLVREDSRRISLTAPSAQTAPAAKVAQKPVLPRKNEESKPEKDKKVIDNARSSAYSDGIPMPANLNGEEQAIVSRLLNGERLVDELIAETGLPSHKVLAALTLLEVKGIVKTLPGRRVTMKM